MTDYRDINKIGSPLLQRIDAEIKEEKKRFEPIPFIDLLAMDFPAAEWIVENLVPDKGLVCLSGREGSFKTWLAIHMGISVASGAKFLDTHETTQGGVLYIDEETGLKWIKDRIVSLSNINDMPFYLLSYTDFVLSENTVEVIISLIKRINIKLIVLDSFVRVHGVRDENNSAEIAKVFRLLRKITNQGVSILFTHHNRKNANFNRNDLSQEVRGSSDIMAAVDSHIAVMSSDNAITLRHGKSRHIEKIDPQKYQVITGEKSFKFVKDSGFVDDVVTKKDDYMSAIIDQLSDADEPMYKKELFIALGDLNIGSYSTFKDALGSLKKDGKIKMEHGGKGNKTYCSLINKE